ncbi:MAG: hypothetical protein WBA77_22130 [Microcoleaceae cyanobacterium]
MNADTYKSYSVTCPICHQTSIVPSVGILGGLFTCPHCHTHFVISHSGHYVRDPFCLRRWAVGKMLRRQSHPLARIGRDFSLTKRLPFAVAISSLLFISMALVATNRLMSQQPILEAQTESVETERTQ